MRLLTLSFAVCLGLFVWTLPARAGIHADGKQFKNDEGAHVVFRGFAIHAKLPPFRPVKEASDLDILQEVGANLVRLHFNWEAAEPQEGRYDQSYLDYYNQVIEWAWARGLYVIIDFHNNAFSRYAAEGCGCGFPGWAITPDVKLREPRENGDCRFFYAMTKAIWHSEENYAIWRDFLNDAHGARSRFFELTTRLAAKYAQHPAVLGFDLNEPLPYDTKTETFDYELLKQFYEAWAQVIHAAKPDAFVFVEPFATDHIGAKVPPPMPKPEIANIVYAPHLYEPGSIIFGFPMTSMTRPFETILAMREQWNVPVLIGEWGAQFKGWEAVQAQLDALVRQMDAEQISATRWNYTPNWTPELRDHFHDEDYSCFDQDRKWRVGCRPRAYVQVVSGEQRELHLQHKGESRRYAPWLTWILGLSRYEHTRIELSWVHDPRQGKTRIFASRRLLFDGQPVRILTEGAGLYCGYDEKERFVSCASDRVGLMKVTIE